MLSASSVRHEKRLPLIKIVYVAKAQVLAGRLDEEAGDITMASSTSALWVVYGRHTGTQINEC
ncbi:MAG: hypothetical protein ABS69_09820 [Nitrosomonadales bacterium SCN 54-20]|nr:MAG: hypothetical protein ABS69_09820 [Nitrosomonadales bacterium SCN 54-20]